MAVSTLLTDILWDWRRVRAGRALRLVPVAMVRVVPPVTAAGCGGGSSKAAYCSDRAGLNSDVKGPSSAASSAVSGLKPQLATIQSDGTAPVDSAKSDFPSQTSAIKSSVATLASAVKALPASPLKAQITAIAADAASVASAVKSLSDAISSKCG